MGLPARRCAEGAGLSLKITRKQPISYPVKWIFLLIGAACFAQTPAELQRRALDLQRAAAQKQAEAAGAHMKPWGDVVVQPGPAFECPAHGRIDVRAAGRRRRTNSKASIPSSCTP